MSNEEKSFHVIEFLGKKTYCGSWSKNFLSCEKRKGYRKLLVSTSITLGVVKIPVVNKRAVPC